MMTTSFVFIVLKNDMMKYQEQKSQLLNSHLNNMEQIKHYVYYDQPITFDFKDGNVMVNATEMAKQFRKTPKDWLRTQQATDFIDSLSAVRHISPTELILVLQGGGVQGTWMHEDVAMEFARWLSSPFAIWCNDRIKELITHGGTVMNPEDLLNPDFIISLATKLKEERAEKELYMNLSQRQSKEIEASLPKVEYYDGNS